MMEITTKTQNQHELTVFTQKRRGSRYFLCLLLIAANIFLLFLTTHLAYADPDFTTRRIFGSGHDDILSMTVGDMNGDGSLDLINHFC